jgi:hypothetical protein
MIRKDLAILAGGLLLALSACSGSAESQAPPPPQVTVAEPLVSDILDWDDFVGRFEAIDSVEVKPRLALANIPTEERGSIYLLRLAAFLLILVAIYRKNRGART